MQSLFDPLGPILRRDLLKCAAALAVSWSTPPPAQPSKTILAYVGSYTGNGQGIYLFQVNPSTGALTLTQGLPE